MYEMATLKHAFNAKDMNALVYKILKGKVHNSFYYVISSIKGLDVCPSS